MDRGLDAVEQIQVRPGPPGAGHAGPAAGRRRGDPGQAGRRVRGRVQVRRHAGPGAPDRRRGDRAVHPAVGAGQRPVPGRGGGPGRRAGPGRGDRRGRGRRVRRGHRRAAPVRRGHVPAAQVRHRRGGAGRAGRPVLLRAALRGRPGPDPAAVPGAAGRPGRGDHPLGPAAADHREFGARPGRAGRGVRAGHHRRLRGADVQVGEPGFRLPGRQPRLAVDQAQARLPHRAVRHRRPGRRRRVRRARPPGRRLRRGAAGRLRPGRGRVPHGEQVRRRVLRRRPGRAAGQAGAAGPPGTARPGRRPAAARRVVRARAGAGDPQRRADPVAELLGGLGRGQTGRRTGHAVPPVHREMARRQGPGGRDHHRRAGRPVPHRAACAGGS